MKALFLFNFLHGFRLYSLILPFLWKNQTHLSVFYLIFFKKLFFAIFEFATFPCLHLFGVWGCLVLCSLLRICSILFIWNGVLFFFFSALSDAVLSGADEALLALWCKRNRKRMGECVGTLYSMWPSANCVALVFMFCFYDPEIPFIHEWIVWLSLLLSSVPVFLCLFMYIYYPWISNSNSNLAQEPETEIKIKQQIKAFLSLCPLSSFTFAMLSEHLNEQKIWNRFILQELGEREKGLWIKQIHFSSFLFASVGSHMSRFFPKIRTQDIDFCFCTLPFLYISTFYFQEQRRGNLFWFSCICSFHSLLWGWRRVCETKEQIQRCKGVFISSWKSISNCLNSFLVSLSFLLSVWFDPHGTQWGIVLAFFHLIHIV